MGGIGAGCIIDGVDDTVDDAVERVVVTLVLLADTVPAESINWFARPFKSEAEGPEESALVREFKEEARP